MIEQVGPTPVKDADSFASLMAAAKKSKRPAALLVNTDGRTRFATLRLDN